MANRDDNLLGAAGRAAAGLAVGAVAAYGVYLLGAPRGRRRPVTELSRALTLKLDYVPWRGLYYAYYGRRGAGRPIVVLHGAGAVASAHEVRPLVQRLRERTDRDLFVPEWLGFGHSDRPDVDYAPELLEEQLEHFLDHVVGAGEGGVDIVGYSLGASYAAGLAARRPELVRSLVAIEPAGLGREPKRLSAMWGRLLFTLPGVQRAFFDRITRAEALRTFAAESLFTPEFGVPDEFVEHAAETARAEGASRPFDDLVSGRLHPDDVGGTLARLRQPVLIIHGTVANRRLESFRELPDLEARPNTEIITLATGAYPQWEKADDVAAAIGRFLVLEPEEAKA
jgi:pimeloyl-ACP methyl ester carboxylesterase